MLVMFIFMNTGSATAAIHVMMDVVHGNLNAESVKTKAWRALLHRSVRQITNDVEACHWQPPAKCFVRTEFVAFMASGSWCSGRRRCAHPCIRLAPPLFRPQDWPLHQAPGWKPSRYDQAGSMRCSACLQARTEKPAWSTVMDGSSGMS
jgi:hypothetical protein